MNSEKLGGDRDEWSKSLEDWKCWNSNRNSFKSY